MSETIRVMPTHIVAVGGVVTNDQGQILLVKTHNYHWVFPGGQVEEGENLIEALKREIREESGIEVEVGELFCISSNTRKYPGYNGVKVIPTKVMMDFVCKATGGVLGISEENSESGWFAPEDVLAMIEAPAIVERFQAYLQYEGRPTYLSYVAKPEFELAVKRQV